MRKRVCDAAVEVLRETDNPAVMWGDDWLLHEIAVRSGMKPSKGQRRVDFEQRVLNALTRQPGILIPKKTYGGNRIVRIFRLPGL